MPNINKELQKQYARKHYLKNKTQVKDRAASFKKLAILRNKEYIKEYLKEHPCIDCGVSDIRCLEFDHVRGEKSFNISKMVLNAHSLENIVLEISKCDVRCANCHRIQTRLTVWNQI